MDTFQTQLSLNNHNLFAPSSNWKGIKPQDNLIVGFNIGTYLDDRKIAIDFDWNLSLYNKDIWDGALSIAQLDTSIDDSLDGFIGRTYDENGDPVFSPLVSRSPELRPSRCESPDGGDSPGPRLCKPRTTSRRTNGAPRGAAPPAPRTTGCPIPRGRASSRRSREGASA